MKKLTNQEEEVMKVIWKYGKGFIKDYLQRCPEPKPPYTTLASTIRKLEKKGYVRSRKLGPINEYEPVITQEIYKKTFMKGFVKDYFKNSYKEVVAFFAEQEEIDSEELKEIIDMIETGKEQKS